MAQVDKIKLAHGVNAITLVKDFTYTKCKICGGKESSCVYTKYNDHTR